MAGAPGKEEDISDERGANPEQCPTRVLAVSKPFAAEVWDEAGLRCELLFPAFDYARIAAISGWMPMMFITRVRL